MMKKCCGCQKPLPESMFNRHRGTYDGLQGMCRRCQSKYNRKRKFEPDENPLRKKTCSRCGVEYPATLEHFSPARNNKDGMASRCKTCQNDCVKQWNKKHPERASATRAKTVLTRSMKKLGMTWEDLNRLLEEQEGKCAICGTDKPIGQDRRLVIDHDHDTNRPRGLLCSKCNTGIGLLNEDPHILKSAIVYIARWKAS